MSHEKTISLLLFVKFLPFLIFNILLLYVGSLLISLAGYTDALLIAHNDVTLFAKLKLSNSVKLIFFSIFTPIFLIFYRKENIHYFIYTVLALCAGYFIYFTNIALPNIQADPYNNALYFKIFYSLKYIWNGFLVGSLFYIFANQTFETSEAKIFYPLMGMVTGIVGSLTGYINLIKLFPENQLKENISSFGLTLFIASSFTILACHYAWRCCQKENGRRYYPTAGKTLSIPYKLKYLLLIGLFAVLCLLFMDVLTFNLKQALYITLTGDRGAYNEYIANLKINTFYASLLIFPATFWVLKKFDWKKTSFILPVVSFIISIKLFFIASFPKFSSYFIIIPNMTLESAHIMLLTWGLIFFKCAFVTLFLPLKEIAFIPLTTGTKARGKLVIDFIFGVAAVKVLSKPVGATFMAGFGLKAGLPILLVVVSALWILVSHLLAKEYQELDRLY